MAIYLTCEQVNLDSKDIPLDCPPSIDSLNSVVDANVDFKNISTMDLEDNSQNDSKGVTEEWMSDVGFQSNAKSPLHNTKESGEISTVDTQEFPSSTAASSSSYVHNSHFDNSPSLSPNYPMIPFQVAQYINETNPEWCTEGQKYFRLSQIRQSLENTSSTSVNVPISPFRSMAATTEALALQHSVIGNRGITPASPEVVAEIVAKTQLRFKTNCQPSASKASPQKLTAENLRSAYSQNHFDIPNSTASSSKDCVSSKSRRSSVSSIASSICSRKSSRVNCNDNIPTVHTYHKSIRPSLNMSAQNTNVHYIADSETESCFSEKLELESVCSDAFETESNVSEVSGFGDEILQATRLLEQVAECQGSSDIQITEPCTIDVACSPIKVKSQELMLKKDQSVQTETSELLEVIREKANLEGRLESLSKNELELSKDCTNLHSTVASLQAQLEHHSRQLEKAVMEKHEALQKVVHLESQQGKWDNVIKEYQNVIENRNAEIKAFKEDLSEAEQANIQSKITLEELKVDMDLKDGGIAGLKKKIVELHCEVQVLLQSKVQLKNDVKNVQLEMNSLEKSRDWYKDQLHLTQESRDQMHKDIILLQSNGNSLSHNYEKARTEIKHLKQQLNECQVRAVGEKEMLLKHLENIKADMQERESLFEEIRKDKDSVEDDLLERAKRMEDERSKITHLSFTASDLEYQLSMVKSDISEKDKSIFALEKEKAELRKNIALLQKTSNNKEMSIQQLTQNLKDANCKISHQEATAKTVESLMDRIKVDKNAAEMALAAANEEKQMTNEYLKILKDNLHRLESDFKQIKAESVSKTSKISQLLKEKLVLEEYVKKLEEKTVNEQRTFELEMYKENQNCSVIVDDLKKQKQDIENVLEVYSKDLLNCQQRIQSLEQERKNLRNEITKLKNSGKDAEKKMDNLQGENTMLHEEVFSLSQTVSDLNSSADQTNVIGVDDFHKIKKEYSDKLKVYRSNIKILTRKLKEKLKESGAMKLEIQALKESQKNRSHVDESAVESELISERNKVLQLEDELKSLKDVLLVSEKTLEKNQEIIVELEKEKGKISAVSSNNTSLRSQITELESLLAQKDAMISQLSSQNEMNKTETSNCVSNLQNKLASLEEDIKKEKALVKSLREQVFQERRTDSHRQRQLATLKMGLEQANHMADTRKKEISSLQSEMEMNLQVELKQREGMELLQHQIQTYQMEIEKLKKELVAVQAKDPALAQQLKSLSWHLKEKNNKIAANKEQRSLLEERYLLEVDGLKKSLQSLQTELDKNKMELDEVRKQKFQLQAQLMQLRKAFKANFGNFMNASKNETLGNGHPEHSFDETFVNNLLEKSLQVPESRPLNHLQECLNSLKQEMAELQKQICDKADL